MISDHTDSVARAAMLDKAHQLAAQAMANDFVYTVDQASRIFAIPRTKLAKASGVYSPDYSPRERHISRRDVLAFIESSKRK